MAAPWDEKYEKAPAAAPAKSAPPPEATPVITAPVPSTPAALWESRRSAGQTPVQVVTGNMGEAGNAGKNATQDSLAYARQFASDNPEITGALTAIPLAYIANKVAEKTGLYNTLANKIKGDSGPVPTTSNKAPPSTPDVNNTWDIHNKPASVANEQPWYSKDAGPQPWEKQAGSYWNWYDKNYPSAENAPASAPVAEPIAAPAPAAPAAPAAAPSRNLTLEEAQARMAGVTPAAKPETMPAQAAWAPPAAEVINKPSMLSSGTTIGTAPARPVTPTPPAALASTTTPAPVEPTPKAKLTWPGLAEEPGPLRWTANTLGTTKDVKGSQAAFEMAKDRLTALGVDLAPVNPETGKKTGGGLIPEGHAALNDFYQTYTGESLPKGGKIESEQKLKLYDALKTHLEEAHASGTLKNLGRGAIAAASILGISEAVKAAQRGDNSKLAELGFDVGISAIPPLRLAATALMGTTLQSGKLPNGDRDYSEVLSRPGVRQVLDNMSKVMTPAQFNAEADKYLSKVSSFPEYNSSRFTKPVIGSTQPINRRTLLPIAPPR